MSKEFAGDPMMAELHEIRRKHSQASKSRSGSNRDQRMRAQTAKFLANYGYKLVSTTRGTQRLKKVS